jgi:catechol 2,3-dioxygenase-like lactoylglutathione lyase family enzyme
MIALGACSGGSPEKYALKSTLIEGVNYVGISVSDMDEAIAFYQEPAALERLNDSGNNASSDTVETQILRSVNAQIRLMKFQEPTEIAVTPVQGPGIAHVCVQATKSADAYGKFLENGGTAIGDPEMVTLNPRNPVQYAYVEDPDGNVVEVEHVDVAALDLPAPPKNSHRIRHVALATPDIERLTDFYSDLLDEPSPRRIGRLKPFSGENIDKVSGLPGSAIKMSWFQVRNLELEISQYFSHPTEIPSPPRPVDSIGFNMIVFDVNDLAGAEAKFVEAGGVLETLDPSLDDETIFFGRDPDGNLLGFQDVPDSSIFSSQNFANNGAE